MATSRSKPKATAVDPDYIRMYYEHQYERMAEQEQYRLTMTNFVLSVSALAFTFGYKDITQLNVFNGLGLPLIIMTVNAFAIATANRTSQYLSAHQKRAHKVLEEYAPHLKSINDTIRWGKVGIFGGRRSSQINLHLLLILTALIPVVVYIYQIA